MRGQGLVAIILAVGVATAVNCVTVGVLYDAIFSRGPGLSDNATQLLTTAFGGIIGVLGAYVGFRAGIQDTTGQGLDVHPGAKKGQPRGDAGKQAERAEQARQDG